MIHGEVIDSRFYGRHKGYDVICFLVKNPGQKHKVNVYDVTVFFVAQRDGVDKASVVVNDIRHEPNGVTAYERVDLVANMTELLAGTFNQERLAHV